jgi:hypothetical protein
MKARPEMSYLTRRNSKGTVHTIHKTPLLITLLLLTRTPTFASYRFSRPKTPTHLFPISDECPGHFENEKFMITNAQLPCEEPWEERRFHLWYMEVARAGLSGFTVRIPREYFLLDTDVVLLVDFHDMYRVLRQDDLDIAQLTMFSL